MVKCFLINKMEIRGLRVNDLKENPTASCCFQSKATMKHMLILLLLFWDNVEFTLTHGGCTLQGFKQSVLYHENFDLSGLTESYNSGDNVRVPCKVGFIGFIRLICSDGQWFSTGDKCRRVCGSALIPNGFAHEHQNKLYYACNEGYKPLIKGWWGVASCDEGEWKTSECVAATDCGPVPDIPNLSVTSDRPRFSNGDTFPIKCEAGHQNLHPDLLELTCSRGKWTSNDVPFEQICTPIASKCSPPPKVENAIIMGSFEKEYPSGIRLTYKCRKHFVMEGDSTIQCINGSWERRRMSCKEASNPQ